MKQNCVQCGKEFVLTPAQIELYKSKGLQTPKRCRECRMKNREKTGKVNGVRDYSNSKVALEEISDTPFNKKPPTFFIIVLIALVLLSAAAIGGAKAYDYYYADSFDSIDNYADAGFQEEESGKQDNKYISGITEAEPELPEETVEAAVITDETGEEGTGEAETVKPKSRQDNLREVMIEKVTSTEDPFATDEDANASKSYTFKNKSLKLEHYEKHGIDMGFESADEYEQAASAVVNNPDALHKLEAEDGDDVYYLVDTNEFVIVSRRGFIRTYFKPDAGKAYYDRQ